MSLVILLLSLLIISTKVGDCVHVKLLLIRRTTGPIMFKLRLD